VVADASLNISRLTMERTEHDALKAAVKFQKPSVSVKVAK